VFPFVRGHHPDRITPELLVAVGVVAADLHRLTADRPSRIARPYSWRTYLQQLRSVIRQPARPIGGWERFRDLVKTYLTGHARVLELLHQLPSGDIHHDLRVPNLIVDRNNRISAVLDFGECQYGPFALELARIWQSMCVDGRTRRVDGAKAERLLSGYSARRQLDVQQRNAIPDFFQLANLVDAADYLLKISPRKCPTVGHCLSLRAFEANANASAGTLRT
jgi:Ser/Thr protein kinase RdoA (MazF antagonist)